MPRWEALTPQERFMSHVDKTDGCWLWMASKNPRGYGHFYYDGRPVSAHRYSWIIHCHPISSDQHVLHRCDVRNCVNPDHLFLGDQHSNVLDMHAKGRAASKKGELHGRSKLTAEQIEEIRNDPRSQSQIAKDYGLGQSHVSRIRRRENWTHVP